VPRAGGTIDGGSHLVYAGPPAAKRCSGRPWSRWHTAA